MTRRPSRLAFVHRTLWRRDGTYRAAVLLGPPPLLGAALAAALWFGVPALRPGVAPAGPPAPWARVPPAASAGGVLGASPLRPLPPAGPDGALAGLVPGWNGTVYPIELGPTLDAVMGQAAGHFTLDGPEIDLARIAAAAGALGGRYAGVEQGLLAVRTAGRYELAVHLDRSSPQPADCLLRMVFGPGRVISRVELDLRGAVSRSYPPQAYDLQPGIYLLLAAFGCWHGEQAAGPGRMTVLIRHPGEDGLRPARPDDLLRVSGPPR